MIETVSCPSERALLLLPLRWKGQLCGRLTRLHALSNAVLLLSYSKWKLREALCASWTHAETHIYRPISKCPHASLRSSPVAVSERCPEGPEMLHSEGGKPNAHLSVFPTMEESHAANPKPALDCYVRNKQTLYPLSHWVTKMGLFLHLSRTFLTQMLHKIFPVDVLAHSPLHLFELFRSMQ